MMMNRFLLLTFTLIASFNGSAQVYFDTITLEPALKGSIKLDGSTRIGRARVIGYNFEEFSMLYCGSGDEVNNISNIENSDSTLLIRVSVETNCCSGILSEIEIVEDSILNIIYHDYGELCECNCNYCMDYKISYSPWLLNRKSIRQKKDLFVKYAMLNWDRKTLKNIETMIRRK